MKDTSRLHQLRATGGEIIASEGKHDQSMVPLMQDGVVFKQMFEYTVADFEAEVGFYVGVFGFPAIGLTNDYALFTHPEHGYCISFRKDVDAPAPSTVNLKVLFMTTDIPGADAHLDRTGLVPDREIRKGSPVQDVIYYSTPAGVAVEIWEDPKPD